MRLAQLLGSISTTSTILAVSYVLPKMAEKGVYPDILKWGLLWYCSFIAPVLSYIGSD